MKKAIKLLAPTLWVGLVFGSVSVAANSEKVTVQPVTHTGE